MVSFVIEPKKKLKNVKTIWPCIYANIIIEVEYWVAAAATLGAARIILPLTSSFQNVCIPVPCWLFPFSNPNY